MGNYRQHIAFGSFFGVVYSATAAVLGGLHWAYASIAVLLSTIGGLLPDLDSPSGVGLRSLTGMLGVLASLVVWRKISRLDQPVGFEFALWAALAAYVLVRHGLRRVMVRIAVHRGMSHSIPTGAVWGAIIYMTYPTEHHEIRVAMAIAVMLGFLSHLLLDEICSVDLRGVRVNRAFGSALKFWAPSALSTVIVYAVLSFLSWRIIRNWPDDQAVPASLDAPAPAWPYDWPRSWWQDGFKDARVFAREQVEKLPERLEQAKSIAEREFDGLPEDVAKAKKYIAKQLPGAAEELDKAKKAVVRQLPQAAEEFDRAKKSVVRRLPGAADQVKKVAEAVKPPSPRRR